APRGVVRPATGLRLGRRLPGCGAGRGPSGEGGGHCQHQQSLSPHEMYSSGCCGQLPVGATPVRGGPLVRHANSAPPACHASSARNIPPLCSTSSDISRSKRYTCSVWTVTQAVAQLYARLCSPTIDVGGRAAHCAFLFTSGSGCSPSTY